MNLKNRLLFQYYKLLGFLARKYLKKWQPIVIGINGSVGKTSCRMILDEVLQSHLGDQLSVYTSPKNFNGELGMSLSIFKIIERTPSVAAMFSTLRKILSLLKSDTKPYDILILEYGIDRPKEMEFLCSIVKPHISILTKLDAVHSLQFGDAQAIAQEELILQKNTLLNCYINTSDKYGMKIAKNLKTKISYYNTGSSRLGDIKKDPGQKNEVSSSNYTIQKNINPLFSSPLSSSSHLHLGQKEISFTTNILGKIHHDYIALSYDVLELLRNQYNLPPLEMKNQLSLELQAGRFSLFEGIHDSVLVDSSYNSSPLSLRKVIEESNEIYKTLYPDSIRIFILGDMRELGESERFHHEQLAEYLEEMINPEDHIILLGQAMITTYETIKKNNNISHFLDFKQVATKAKDCITELSHNNKHAFVIIKGSQNTIFLEEITKALLAHPADSSLLVRQGSWREHKKGV